MVNRKIDDDLRVRLALARYKPMRLGLPMTGYDKLAAEFGLSIRAIQKAIPEAFELGLVDLITPKINPKYQRDHSLERALIERFPELGVAIVVKPMKASKEHGWAFDNADVHVALGHAVASYINGAKLMFRSNDIVGIGTGRGIHYDIEVLKTMPPVPTKNVTIVSLTGSIVPIRMGESTDYLIDADSNARQICQYFEGPVVVIPTSHPIAYATKSDCDKVRAETFLAEDRYIAPHHAFVGLGMLSGSSNRLVQEANNRDPKQSSPVLQNIRHDLQNLIRDINRIMSLYPDYCPVGDFCNTLFFIPSPQGLNTLAIEEEIKNIKHNINIINDRILTVSTARLKEIPSAILIFGSKEKAAGIHTILSRSDAKITTLCTDAAAAIRILELASNL